MNFLRSLSLILLGCLAVSLVSHAQYYAFGGYSHGFVQLPSINRSIDNFNLSENHSLNPIRSMNGYRFGFGSYGKKSIIELGFSNIVRNQQSKNTSQLKSNAQVVLNYMSVSLNVGWKPFQKQYLTTGLGLTMGQMRLRYSFGGDYKTSVQTSGLSPEFFVDYALKIKFLLKKENRNKMFYLLRIRPYYQVHVRTDFKAFEEELNNPPAMENQDYSNHLSHFGFQATLIIPFAMVLDYKIPNLPSSAVYGKKRKEIMKKKREIAKRRANLSWEDEPEDKTKREKKTHRKRK